ncbi:hypothetical protein [Pseudoalteromonas ruthenica]|uniref:hypothetical protein n=1 Tax=Pseudoalteromonas ruthenica TaxID=151081 RepID=UPI00241C1856|nr:hypothetical protein [Pseudoalteromonas ruthenica]
MRLTALCLTTLLAGALPMSEAMAKPEHFTPPGHAKKMHHGKKHKHKHKHKHKERYERHHHCDHYSHRYDDDYWRIGRHIDYDVYRHGKVLRRDRHGHVIVDMHGDVFRLLENSLEIVEIISRRH